MLCPSIWDASVVEFSGHPGDCGMSSVIISSLVGVSIMFSLFGEVSSLSLLSMFLFSVTCCCFVFWLGFWSMVVSRCVCSSRIFLFMFMSFCMWLGICLCFVWPSPVVRF